MRSQLVVFAYPIYKCFNIIYDQKLRVESVQKASKCLYIDLILNPEALQVMTFLKLLDLSSIINIPFPKYFLSKQ